MVCCDLFRCLDRKLLSTVFSYIVGEGTAIIHASDHNSHINNTIQPTAAASIPAQLFLSRCNDNKELHDNMINLMLVSKYWFKIVLCDNLQVSYPIIPPAEDIPIVRKNGSFTV